MGYSELSFILASLVLKCQLTFAASVFRSVSHADSSLRNCSISRVDYQESLWLASGWVVETAGDISHLDAPALDELQR